MNRLLRLLIVLCLLGSAGFAAAQGLPNPLAPSPGDGPGDASDQSADGPVEETTAEAEDAAERFANFWENDLGPLWEQNDWRNWLALMGGIFGGLVAGKIAQYLLRKIGSGLEQRRRRGLAHLFHDAASPVSLALFTAGLWFGLTWLDGLIIPGEEQTSLEPLVGAAIELLFTVAAFWFLFNAVGIIEVWLFKLTAKTDSTLDDMIVPLIRKAMRIFVVVVALLFIAQNVLGVSITSWLAGLGIVGLAVSLAAQDSLKNLFGSITIFLDRPFLVGSFVKYAGELGDVEEIGFRSTRIRTLGGSLLTVPNSNIVNDPIENIGVRPFIRRVLDVTITYDTPPEKIDRAIEIVREIFQLDGIREAIHDPDNPEKLPPKVYFSDFNAASLNIQVYYWHRPGNWWEYLEHATKFNRELFRRYNEAGIDFAFPTQTIHLAGDENRPLTIGVRQTGNGDDRGGGNGEAGEGGRPTSGDSNAAEGQIGRSGSGGHGGSEGDPDEA